MKPGGKAVLIWNSRLTAFFKERSMREAKFFNRQIFDYEGLRGRLQSSSYCPPPDHPNHEPMMKELRHLFESHQQDGVVLFDYETEVYWGEV